MALELTFTPCTAQLDYGIASWPVVVDLQQILGNQWWFYYFSDLRVFLWKLNILWSPLLRDLWVRGWVVGE